jgi:alginate O-acetyltransferase complex protein AlgI
MLFNSYAFLFAFLPAALIGFYFFARRDHRVAAGWLAVASLVFYGYWDVRYVPLLCASILFNYLVGLAISKTQSRSDPRLKGLVLAAGIVVDLALLGYFKYANFFVVNVDAALRFTLPVPQIVLPLGISFFTFTQIAYLVDVSRGLAKEYSFTHYTLFVSYFPHLIAGPILHHKEMIPQFRTATTYQFRADNFAKGLAFFVIGLFKKVVLADGVSQYVAPVFAAAGHGGALSFVEAWGGALAYTVQLYFDFSGYSDMAVGLSWLFNVRLPFNFNSPYKAADIIDFWRRWHMTLSRFLRDYLYFSLGGNRRGGFRRYTNLLITMLLGGLWHGASWTFVFWGALHGAYLMINHGWSAATKRFKIQSRSGQLLANSLSRALTLLAVVVAWVFFRSPSIKAALGILASMFGMHGITVPQGLAGHLPGGLIPVFDRWGIHFGSMGPNFHGLQEVSWIVALLWISLALPNSQEWIEPSREGVSLSGRFATLRSWAPNPLWAVALGLATAWCILQLGNVTEFLYFQF